MSTFTCSQCRDQCTVQTPLDGDIPGVLAEYARLMELITGEGDIPQPLCKDCAASFLRKLDKQARVAEEELQAYRRYVEEVKAARASLGVMNEEQFRSQLDLAIKEEERLRQELRAVEQSLTDTKAESAALQAEQVQLEQLEASYWAEYNEVQLQMDAFGAQRAAMACQITTLSEQLAALRTANVLSDTFHIWTDATGHIGTINRLRLGKLPTVAVEWPEINAALGLACLLVERLVRRYQIPLRCVRRLVPMGSASKLESADGTELDLCFTPAFLQSTRRFNQALALFAGCVAEVEQFIQTSDPTFKPLYPIEFRDRLVLVGGQSVALDESRSEGLQEWTRCMRHLLLNLKNIQAWAAQAPPWS